MPTDSLSRYPEERRLATVLFADVQGFTALAEQLDFETVSDMIKDIWMRLDRAIEMHNGYIDKHIGDGVMALWGAPFAGDNDAEEAVAAGMDLIKALAEFCKTTKIPGAETLKLRVGINTGSVFAAYIGNHREYTVIGDIVNVAARLEQIAEPGTVAIGENTLRMVRNSFRVRKMEPTKAKGKTELVQPYAVEGRLATPGRIRYQSADSLVTHMVGRDEEIKKLNCVYEGAFGAGEPLMALLSGDVGIGKSRLLMEFGNLIEASSEEITILTSRGLAQAAKIPFYLWRMLLRSRFGIDEETEARAVAQQALQATDSTEAGNQPGAKVNATQVLGEMIRLAGQGNIEEEQLKRIHYLTRELLRRIGTRRRMILLLDDLQWADRESLQLLAYLLTNQETRWPMLVIGAARPEFLKNHTQWHNLSRVILLNPLGLQPELVAKAYPDLHYLPETVLREIAIRAEGNPYFLEEIVKSILKLGLPENNGGNVEDVYRRILAQVPESLRATLQARLDNLSREARTVALIASVVGRVFWVGAVMAAARSETLPGSTAMITVPELVIDRFIQDGLRQLVRAELAFPRDGSKFSEEQEYIFKNSYLRDVAYNMIPNRNRAQFHKAVADWMKKKTDPVYQTMAHEHEQNAVNSVKIATGSLPVITENQP